MVMMKAKRGQNIQMFFNQAPPMESDEDRFWNNLVNRIGGGQVIPIIGNAMIYDLIFSKALADQPAPPPDCAGAPAGADTAAQAVADDNQDEEASEPSLKMNIANQLSQAWAMETSYPLTESHDLPHVAQYVRSKSRSPMDVKEEFINFMKNALLTYASQIGVGGARIQELRDGLSEFSIADLVVKELKLLEFGPGSSDPLSILAGLPLPIYITTCYHDILERALLALGKQPITQVCFWSGAVTNVLKEHQPIETFTPSPQTPLVYHLYGLDAYPLTMVLSEDDFLDFLVEVTVDRGTTRSIIPAYLQSALAVSWLMMLGFRLPDWDFRVLFRGLINAGEKKNSAFLNTIIQLSLSDQYELPGVENADQFLQQVQKYLQGYFNPLSFEIRWDSPSSFLGSLQKEWRNRRQK